MEISLIISAFNEVRRIGPTLRRFYQFLAARPTSCEIIVVDDGSTDETVALVTALASEQKEFRVIRSLINKGKRLRSTPRYASGRGTNPSIF